MKEAFQVQEIKSFQPVLISLHFSLLWMTGIMDTFEEK